MARPSRTQAAMAFALLSLASATAQTIRVSVDSSGAQGDAQSGFYEPAISNDGRLVALASYATNLVPGDTNGAWDVFVHDLGTGGTRRVSVDASGSEGNGDSGGIWGGTFYGIDLSANGRFVAYLSSASNLVPGDTNGLIDIFVTDLQTGTVARSSVSSSGAESDGDSFWPSLSEDGRYVSFYSSAANLVPGDTNNTLDVFRHDLLTGRTDRVSVSSNGDQGNDVSWRTQISLDGRLVGFSSYASNLVASDANGKLDSFVHDVVTGQTLRISVDEHGVEGSGESEVANFSADLRFASFASSSALVSGDSNGAWDDYLRDMITGKLTRSNVDSHGNEANDSCFGSSISADGRHVAFSGYASNLVPNDGNGTQDVFLHDRATGITSIASVSSQGEHGNGESCYPVMSADGRVVAFTSHSTNLVAGDTNTVQDVFVFVRSETCDGDPGFTLLVPREVPIGGIIDMCLQARPDDRVIHMVAGGPGPTDTPMGRFCLDFPPIVVFPFVMPGSGARCFHPRVPCDPSLIGRTAYLQFLAIDPASGSRGISNQAIVTLVPGHCP